MIKEEWIKILENAIVNDYKFRRGFEIKNRGLISDFKFKKNKNDFSATAHIAGNYDNHYNTSIFMKYDGSFVYCRCDCLDKQNRNAIYFCKHSIALAIETIHYLIDSYIELNVLEKEDIDELINDYEYVANKKTNIEKLNFEYELKIDQPGEYGGISIGLKAGTTKLYVVKDLTEFLLTYKKLYNECELNKMVTYRKENYEISEKDIEILEMMYDVIVYENIKMYRSPKRYLTIPINYLSQFYNKLKDLNTKYSLKEYEIKMENPDLKIFLKEEDNQLLLKLNNLESLEGFFPYDGVIIYDNKYYITDKEYKNKLMPILKVLLEHNGEVLITNENKEALIQNILPYLVFDSNKIVELDPKIKAEIAVPFLNTKLYIDKEGKMAKLNLVFEYDNDTPEKYVLKNLKKEQEIINILNKVNLIKKDDKYYIDDLEDIFMFTEEVIPLLQDEHVAIFYSEDFKNMLKKRNFSYQTSIGFKSDLLAVNFEYDDIDESELKEILKNIKLSKKYYQLKDGNIIKIDNKEALEWSNIIDNLDIDSKDINSKQYLFNKYESLYLNNVFENIDNTKINYDEEFKYLIENIKNTDKLNFELPTNLSAKLRDYQVKGYRWLKTLKYFGFGGILADDMGLGKTLQVITLIQDSKNQNEKSKSLVVAPSSVIYNWEAELNKFAPTLKYIILAESKEIREKHFENLDEYDVIVTSYALIRRDIEKYLDYDFDYCFLDEAQYIKNLTSSSANACKMIKAENKFAMTGTPIENSLSELFSIFDFIMPGYLKSYNHFKNNYEKPIVISKDEEALNKLYNKVKPFILRREKKTVALELPLKQEKNIYITLEGEQKKIYMAHFLKAKKEIGKELTTKGFNKSQIKILSILTRLRQICCHPSLFIDNYNGSGAKLDYLLELIDDKVSKGHRILLFSQFTSMLDIIQQKLDKNSYFRIDGSIKTKERMDMVNRFNMGEKEIFLISLRAGGTGLNLVGADTVIHFDPWWNPAVEDQATDRAYRIGQENRVEVYKLITKNTIEEKINELKDKKREVANAIIKSGETFINKLSEEELANILSE